MRTTTEDGGSRRILHLSGRMTAGRFDERLPDMIRRMVDDGARTLILDLHEVSYMDSTCLGEIVESYLVLKRQGGRLRLTNVPEPVQRLLDISRLEHILCGPEADAGGSGTPSA